MLFRIAADFAGNNIVNCFQELRPLSSPEFGIQAVENLVDMLSDVPFRVGIVCTVLDCGIPYQGTFEHSHLPFQVYGEDSHMSMCNDAE